MTVRPLAAGARLSATSLLALIAAACGTGGTYSSFDVNDGSGAVLSADMRAIIVMKDVAVQNGSSAPLERKVVVCAEPQPDAMRAVAEQISAALQGRANVPTQAGVAVDASGSGSLSAAASEAVAQLGKRTPTIQLMRDALYRSCEGVANGILGTQHVEFIASRIDNLMLGLHAIDGLTGMHAAPTVAIGTLVGPNAGGRGATTPNGTEATTAPQNVSLVFNSGSTPSVELEKVAAEVRKIVSISLLDRSCGLNRNADPVTVKACLEQQGELMRLAFGADVPGDGKTLKPPVKDKVALR